MMDDPVNPKPNRPYGAELRWIPAWMLQVDHTYQRLPRTGWTDDLEEEWDIEKCEPLSVSQRPDGTCVITEGQRRHAVALKIDPNMLLPCFVRKSKGLAQEASDFLSANNKKPQTTQEKWKAKIVEGTDIAYLDAKLVLEKHGLHVGDRTERHTVAAVSAVIFVIKKFGLDYLDSALTIIEKAWGDEERPFSGVIIKGIATALYRNRERHLDLARLDRRLQKHSTDKWKSFARRTASGSFNEGSSLATAVADEYNKSLRSDDSKMLPFNKRYEEV